ncbi:hypothetical protein [Sporisorium scitamineum]|uniref:Uncharacterized protein n=1 Tax=Sporisorium scitamineum TaxID=49012 RepID=A0A0F7RVL0_9BASI|nr:hypothetical protein [Sporisorium scitamineum]
MSTWNVDDESIGSQEATSSANRPPLAYGTLRLPEVDELVSSSEVIERLKAAQGHFHILCLQHADLGDDKFKKIFKELRPPSTPSEQIEEAAPSLDLRANKIDSSSNALIRLVDAVGKSALRCLALSNNPISFKSLAAFIDAIPTNGTALEQLELSHLGNDGIAHDGTPCQGTALAVTAIINFISDPQRCRSLFRLSLNGNNFGGRGVRSIVSALVGSKCDYYLATPDSLAPLQQEPFFQWIFRAKWRRPNGSLLVLDLEGNVMYGWRLMDPQEEIGRFVTIKQRYASIPLQDIEAIVSFLHHRARKQQLQGKMTIDNEGPIEVVRHLATLGVTMDEWQADFQEAFEIGSGLNSLNWSRVLRSHCSNNYARSSRCRSVAYVVLAAARTLGCRARRQTEAPVTKASGAGKASAGFHRFLDLPPELRLDILRQLDEKGSLSARQFSNVVSFACEPSTIGYGEYGYGWSHILDKGVDSVDGTESRWSATLPARPWSWAECFALRAPPRDWEADRLDASQDHMPHVRGRLFDASASQYAFLESTLTHRPE